VLYFLGILIGTLVWVDDFSTNIKLEIWIMNEYTKFKLNSQGLCKLAGRAKISDSPTSGEAITKIQKN
jgi:hypothetical protein